LRLLNQAKEDSSSLLWLRDDNSVFSHASHFTVDTVDSEAFRVQFPFDGEILSSMPYRNAMKTWVKSAGGYDRNPRNHNPKHLPDQHPPAIKVDPTESLQVTNDNESRKCLWTQHEWDEYVWFQRQSSKGIGIFESSDAYPREFLLAANENGSSKRLWAQHEWDEYMLVQRESSKGVGCL